MKVYTKQQVYEETIKYFNGDELPTNVWIDKYCLKNKEGQYLELSPDDMHKRLAKEFARIEQKYLNPLSKNEIYSLLNNFDYIIPGGSILYGVGNNYSISSLGNCFVIGNNSDSYGGICTTDQEQCQLHKRRSGVGHDLSHIRPKDSLVTNSAGTSTGIIPFMERYSNSTREVAQDGRRGATMLSININHPDIEDFIESKSDLSKITGANISVKVTDEFMKAVENDEEYILTFPTNLIHEGIINSPTKGEVLNVDVTNNTPFPKSIKWIKIKAKKLWDKLIHQATATAEPGILFWDTIKNESIPSCYGKEWEETSTNPCGEIPLCPYDSCRLVSVNLYSFVENPFTDKASFNYDKFKDVVYKAQRLMDGVIDLEEEKINKILKKIENDPEPDEIKAIEKNLWLKIRDKLLKGRRTGLSAIGLADCLAALGYNYGTESSISITEEIYKQFAISAYKSSIDMSEERGAFPIYDYHKEKNNPFLQRLGKDEKGGDLGKYSRRNIALLTVPPSGSISMFGNREGISSGIEPVYQLSYKRRRKVDSNHPNKSFKDQNGDWWEEYTVLHPKYEAWMKQYMDNSFMEQFIYGESIINSDHNPYNNSTAYEIDPLQRVKLQATIQKYCDHSISSTINLKKGTTEEEVSNLYMEAWKQGCKGLTIYVDECRTGVLVSNDTKSKDEFQQHDAPKRPKELISNIHSVKIKGVEYHVIVGLYNDKPYEVFVIKPNTIKPNTEFQHKIIKVKSKQYILTTIDWNNNDKGYNFGLIVESMSDEEQAITRLVSTSLRHGADIKFVTEQLNKTHGDLTNFSKGIARVLKKYIKDNEASKEKCPECNKETIVYKDGCKQCTECGYSACG